MRKILQIATVLLVLASVFGTTAARATTTFTFVSLSPTSTRTFFYGGSTMPFKFQLFDSSGNIVSTATATITVNGSPGTTNGGANTGNSFRFDQSEQAYIYNLSTKNLPVPGPNIIDIFVSDGSVHEFTVTFH